MKFIRPISSSTVQKATGATTEPSNFVASHGESDRTAKTPRRAIAISSPMANAISLPSNHLAMARDTVIPAISQPQPKIMKPRQASFALPGIETHHELSHSFMAEAWNQSLMATYLMAAPITMSDAERVPVKRMPILSRMIPATIRKPQTFRMYSEAA